MLLPGYLVIKLKRHCEDLAELTPEEAAALGSVVRRVCSAACKVVGPERVYVCSWGEGVRHVHFHVIPQPSGMPAGNLPVTVLLRTMMLLYQVGIERFVQSDEDVFAEADRLRSSLRKR